MGSIKDLMLDLEAERFDEWLEENYPDVVPDSEQWEQAASFYYWEQEMLADQAQWDHEHELFVASLNNVHQRYLHAIEELEKLSDLLEKPQNELVYRMSFVHIVTVMEAYLMYCARALLEHDWPLRRFIEEYYQNSEINKQKKREAREMSIAEFRPVAKRVFERMTFHKYEFIEHYFSTVLHVSPVWPTEPLKTIPLLRNDLVHRNGVDKKDIPVIISAQLLQKTLQQVRDLIDAANLSMQLEVDLFGNGCPEENKTFISSLLNSPPVEGQS